MILVLKTIFQNTDPEYRVLLVDANASYAHFTSFVVYSCLKQRHLVDIFFFPSSSSAVKIAQRGADK